MLLLWLAVAVVVVQPEEEAGQTLAVEVVVEADR